MCCSATEYFVYLLLFLYTNSCYYTYLALHNKQSTHTHFFLFAIEPESVRLQTAKKTESSAVFE